MSTRSTLDYDPTTALVVVDVQNDFAHPHGSLFVAEADRIVESLAAEIERAVAADAPVVYTQDWHPPETPHFIPQGGQWPVHCVAHTWGAELVDGLPVRGPVVRKGTGGEDGYSGFSVRDPVSGQRDRTELDALLTARGVGRLVVTGLALDVCVAATVLDAVAHGYETLVPIALSRPVDLEAGDGYRAVAEMAVAGARIV